LLEESLLAGLLLGLLGGEVLGLGDLVDLLEVKTADVDLVRGGDHVSGVDSSERDAVDLEGAGDEENTLVESLQEDDTLAAEAAGEEDQDGTGLEGLARGPGTDGLANLLRPQRLILFSCGCVVKLCHLDAGVPIFLSCLCCIEVVVDACWCWWLF
jgi:hypothetical protein